MNNKPIITKKYTHDDEYYYKIIAENIRKYRLEQNMSQEELAELTDISRCYVSDIENLRRKKHITIAILGRIAETLNKNIGDFFNQ